MTNNTAPQTTTDLDRLITFLEKDLFARNEVISLHQRQLARWSQEKDFAHDLPAMEAQVKAEIAARDAINLALQEAKAIAEGY